MNLAEERLHLLKMHPCARGLSDETLSEVAASTELIRCRPGDILHRPGDLVTSIYLIIHGRLKTSLFDTAGRVVMQRFQGTGGQFGGVAAALAEPSPIECVAEDPTTLLKLDYFKSLELTKKRAMAESVKRTVYNDRLPNRPYTVAFMHQDDTTRIVTSKLFQRLSGYGEKLGVLSDRSQQEPLPGVECCQVLGGERDWTVEEIRDQSARWLQTGRLFADVSVNVNPERAANVLEKAELVFWCVTPQNWQSSVSRLRDIESIAPGWRDKVRLLWLLKPGESAPIANELRDLAWRDVKVTFGSPGQNQGHALFTGFERLVHRMALTSS